MMPEDAVVALTLTHCQVPAHSYVGEYLGISDVLCLEDKAEIVACSPANNR